MAERERLRNSPRVIHHGNFEADKDRADQDDPCENQTSHQIMVPDRETSHLPSRRAPTGLSEIRQRGSTSIRRQKISRDL